MTRRSSTTGSKILRWDKQKTAELFKELHEKDNRDARDELIRMYMNLVEYLARQFRNRGESYEDLVQVGMIGLIKAIDRFDPGRAVEFTTYATPTIVGEIKRHFRDKGWAVRIPRRLQELNLKLNENVNMLTQKFERSPTIQELADHLGVTTEEVIEAMETGQAYSFVSLDGVSGGDDDDEGSVSLLDYVGQEDRGFEKLNRQFSLQPAYRKLDDREKQILHYRFYKGLTQTEIAKKMGISQMHVSRLLRRALSILRSNISEEEE